MGSRKSGWVEYVPLWRHGGGGGRTPPREEKNANTDVCVFSTSRPPATAGDYPSPFEPLRDGFVTGTERSGVERTNPSYFVF
jgi:hypothetical protein